MARFVAGRSNGNLREIRPSGSPDCPYAAYFRGVLVGYYGTEENAYAGIQEALRAHLDEGNNLTRIERMRRGK